MRASRKRGISGTVLLLGIAALAVAGVVALQASLGERYWLSRLESAEGEEELVEAARRLGELGSLRALPRLMEALELATRGCADGWRMDRFTSRLTVVDPAPLAGPHVLPPSQDSSAGVALLACVDAIRSISTRASGRLEKLLRPYLRDDREIARAVAASVLFDDRKGAWEYVPSERLLPPPPR